MPYSIVCTRRAAACTAAFFLPSAFSRTARAECGEGGKGAQRGGGVRKRRERKKRETGDAKTVKRAERVRKIKAVRIEGMRLRDWGDRAVFADAKGQKRGRCVGNRGRKMEENLFGTYKMRANVQASDKMIVL